MKPWVWLVFFIIAISISVYLVKSNPLTDKPVNPAESQAPISGEAVPSVGAPSIPSPTKGNHLPGQRENAPNSYTPPNPEIPNRPDLAPVPNQMPDPGFANPPGFYPEPQTEPGMENPGYVPPPPPFPGPEGQPEYDEGEMIPPPIEPPPPIEGQNEADF